MSTEPEIPWYDRPTPRQREMCPHCQKEQPVYAQLCARDNYQGKWMRLRCYICNTAVREYWNLSGTPPREETAPAVEPVQVSEQLPLFAGEGA
jgi:hypothetical protein